jgi:hypothetical protein
MNFLKFNLTLLLFSIPAVIIFSAGVVGAFSPLLAYKGKRESEFKPPKVLLYLLSATAGAFQVYFWGLWSAVCVVNVLRFTHSPTVTWGWLYWIAGFGWSIALIGWFDWKERRTLKSGEETWQRQGGIAVYSLLAIITYVLFALAPQYLLPPYGWAMRLLGWI